MSDMNIKQKMTLSLMLGDSNLIEIPIIQRDYAQGRKNAKEIRTDFLKDIFTHLENHEKMKLSFVYGTVEGAHYVPYDGQQRLTLMYLITLFLASYCEDWKVIEKLSRFTYYTRDFATDFCRFLTGTGLDSSNPVETVFRRVKVAESRNIAKDIKNDSRFFGSWEYEPTVSSMLEVLKSIQEEFLSTTGETSDDRKTKAEEYLKEIEEDGNIFFDWCPIQADENIYVKMNGRGKALSAFDNFKNTMYAELNKLRKDALKRGLEKEVELLSGFEVRMDGAWTDLFWKYRAFLADDVNNTDIAPYMMNFLYYIFELRHSIRSDSMFFGSREAFRWIDEKNVVTFLSKFKNSCNIEKTEEKNRITIDDYIWAEKLLDILCERLSDTPDMETKAERIRIAVDDDCADELQLFKELSNHRDRNASFKVIIVASFYYEYLVSASSSSFDNNGNLNYRESDYRCRGQWLELIRRLVRTAGIFKARFDSLVRDRHVLTGYAEKFAPFVFSISSDGNLEKAADSFDEDRKNSLKEYFSLSHMYSQLVEEIEKNRLKGESEDWRAAIEKAEKDLPYFSNMIYFLIELSRNQNGQPDITQFRRYSDIMQKVVDSNGVVDENLFTAVMLSYADYRISSGESFSNALSLCSNKSTTDAYVWRYFFDFIEGGIKENGKTNAEVLRYALDLIEAKGSIREAYESIRDCDTGISWRNVIIRYPDVLDYPNEDGYFRARHRIICEFEVSNGEYVTYLITSPNVIRQVHSNSEGLDIDLYGVMMESVNASMGKLEFHYGQDDGMIYVRDDHSRYVVKCGNEYKINDKEYCSRNPQTKFDAEEALGYLDSI